MQASKQTTNELLNAFDLRTFGTKAIALNPHLHLTCELLDDSYVWKLASKCSKWLPSNPEPANWHNEESFRRLVSACIGKDRETGTDRLATAFIRGFAGMGRRDALQDTLDDMGLHRAKLSDLLNGDGVDKQKVSRLLRSLQKHGKTPNPNKLGLIGRSHIESVFKEIGSTDKPKYKKLSGHTADGRPFVVEAAFTEADEFSGLVITGCNFSPSIDLPVIRDLDAMLEKQMIDGEEGVAFLLHVAIVAPTFIDRGKSVFRIDDDELKTAIEACVVSVTSTYCKHRKAEERDAERRDKRLEREARKRPNVTLKDAIRMVMPESIQTVSGGGECSFMARDHYYIVRMMIQEHTDAELKQSYFDDVVDEWEVEHGLIEGRERSPRGYAVEPHTGKRIPLGTREVDEYEVPAHLYDTILYFEKKGVLSRLEWGQIAEKYDALIIASEGYAVRAAKALIEAAQRGHKMKVLCFHDADPAGYNIARTLSRATGAHSYNIEVIDAGLHLKEALGMGLETEFFTRKKEMPSGLELDELELEYFTGNAVMVKDRNGKEKPNWVKCRRIELNALSADPKVFVDWVEAKLQEHGVAKKLVPPVEVITAQATHDRNEKMRATIRKTIERKLDIESKIDRIVNDLESRIDEQAIPAKVAKWAETITPRHWKHCVNDLVSEAVRDIQPDITNAVSEAFEGESQ